MGKDPGWLQGRKVEAVANNLRSLDRGEEAEWWLGRGADLVGLLAQAIRWSAEDLRDRLRELALATASEARFWNFEACPAIRSLDLDKEELPPGLPPKLRGVIASAPPAVWWHAPPGAFKSLIGRYLKRRGWFTLKAVE